MTCRELADFISDYLAGELPADVSSTFERHLRACVNCEEYVRQFEATIQAGRAAFAGDEDACDVPEELVRAILAARGSG